MEKASNTKSVIGRSLDKKIPGLSKLQSALEVEADNKTPATSSKELAARYPRAAIYVKAEQCSCAQEYKIAIAGVKAMKLLIAGENICAAKILLGIK